MPSSLSSKDPLTVDLQNQHVEIFQKTLDADCPTHQLFHNLDTSALDRSTLPDQHQITENTSSLCQIG